jgi:low affinity Fe/Cu permease
VHIRAKEAVLKESFRLWSARIADTVGSPSAFALGVLGVFVWAISGPFYHYSDTWQLVINSGTSVITFLMVFLIQSTQNRDAKAMQMKLNELIRAMSTARNTLLDLENCSEDELQEIHEEFAAIRARVMARRDKRQRSAKLYAD